ncbi:MAG TPA: hypothetical protein VGM73_08550 [Candidatus Didemnitutus sp.]|jgi:hypothetical protein
MPLSPAEKVELAAIPCAAIGAGLAVPAAGFPVEVGILVSGGALVLLVQGGMRDVWLLLRARRRKTPPARIAACMCVESAVGLTVLLAGVALVGFGLTNPVVLRPVPVALGAGGVLAIGFALKDFVFEWSPWRIRREKNHAQIVVRFRAK